MDSRAICSQLQTSTASNSTCQRHTESGKTSGSRTCSLSKNERLITYSALIVALILTNFLRGCLFYLVCNNASRVLHNRMFNAILKTPVHFFDANPSGQFSFIVATSHFILYTVHMHIGRILNRFSNDVAFLDDLLPQFFLEYLIVSHASLLICSCKYFEYCSFFFASFLSSW